MNEIKSDDGLYEIADAIREHSKSIDNLSQIVRWSFMDDFDKNVPNRIEQLTEAFQYFNVLIEEAGRLLGIADKKGIQYPKKKGKTNE